METPGQASNDLAAIKARQQQTWATGDYARVGNSLVLIGELLCEAVDVRSGQRVLDVATGSGNTALAAARRFCEVTGIDYVPGLIEQAKSRAAAEGFTITFEVGDAEAIPFPDASFDVVLSTLGVMFAPDQERAAAELLRVCRPGGKIGMANWTPDGFIGHFFRLFARHVPPPAGVQPPILWGTEARLRELFGDGISALDVTKRDQVFRFPSARFYREYFQTYFGPTMKAFAALDADGQQRLAEELEALIEQFNRSGDETMVVPAEHLEVVAIRST